MDKREQFELACAQLYATFARYPARPTMSACSCCVTREEIVALTTVPLRSLIGDDLGRYACKAMSTWGDSEDFRHFLPRLLELCMPGPEALPVEIETVCRKLAYAQWTEWPQEERQAIVDYLLAFWQLLLIDASYELNCPASDFLEALSQTLEDLSPFLHVWRQSNEATALRALANFVNEHGHDLGLGHNLKRLSGSSATKRQVVMWLLEPETRQQLEDGFFRYVEQDGDSELAAAADMLFFTICTIPFGNV